MKWVWLFGAVLLMALPAAAREWEGPELAARLNCRACHTWAGAGGTTGPALDGVGTRLSRLQLEARLTQSVSRRMPSFAFLRPAEWQALLDFLQGL